MKVLDYLREVFGDMEQGDGKRYQLLGVYGLQMLFVNEEEPPTHQQILVAVEEIGTGQQDNSQDRSSTPKLEQRESPPTAASVFGSGSHSQKAEAIWRSTTRAVFRKNSLSANGK